MSKWQAKWDAYVQGSELKEALRYTEGQKFIAAIEEKLKRGAEQYGDATFEMSLLDVVKNIKEEVVDIAGWSYFAWLADLKGDKKMALNLTISHAMSAWDWCSTLERQINDQG